MVTSLMEPTIWIDDMDLVSTSGKMAACMKENFITISDRVVGEYSVCVCSIHVALFAVSI
jgi:hypothetical protein